MQVPPSHLFTLGDRQFHRIINLNSTELTLLTKAGSQGSLVQYLNAANVGVCTATRIEVYLKKVDQTLGLLTTKGIAASTGIPNFYSLLHAHRLPPGVELWAKTTIAIPLGITVEIGGRHIGNSPAYLFTSAIASTSRRAKSVGTI